MKTIKSMLNSIWNIFKQLMLAIWGLLKFVYSKTKEKILNLWQKMAKLKKKVV